MSTENNWLTCNLKERFTNFNADFLVIMKPQPFKYISFEKASIQAAKKIVTKNENVYLSLSGGLDSEYILVLFHELKIPIKPIIIVCPANEMETSYAFHMCKKLNIEPIVINITNDIYIQVYVKEIANRINGFGWNVVPIIFASKYANDRGGSLITGEHVIDDEPLITKVSMCEWDFYPETLYPERQSYGLLTYTPEITYAIVNAYDGNNVQEFKSNLFNLNFRPKIKNKYTLNEVKRFEDCRKSFPRPNSTHFLGEKDDFLNMMKKWNE